MHSTSHILKYYATITCLLIILTSLTIAQPIQTTPTTPYTTLSRGTLYVGGTGPGNYTTIQDAVAAANQIDTIFVYNGTYTETINIGKKISLIGENPETTIIKGAGGADHVLNLVSSNIYITGFTINGNNSAQNGISIFSLMEDCEITNNTFIDCADGIVLQLTTKRIHIHHNHITQPTFSGIHLIESDRNTIEFNTIDTCGEWGIHIASLSKQNTIYNNTLTDNNGGIKLAGTSTQNTITYNTITGSTTQAILITGLSSETTLTYNLIMNNYAGIKITGSTDTMIEYNHIAGNTMEGILLLGSNNNQILRNNFLANKRHATLRFSFRNTWEYNYWDNWIGLKFSALFFQKLPKIIIGLFRINFDQHPEFNPHTIP